jgi:DivIVA domain-containing protein
MEWTAQSIRAVEFREKLRGYHPDDVDAFVERVAVAFEQLQQAVVEARSTGAGAVTGGLFTAPEEAARETTGERASTAETISEETIRRTLVMAQRTADMVLSEAQESAAKLLADAQAEAAALLGDATQRGEHMAADAYERLTKEVAELEATRAQLQDDAALLEEYVAGERRRLREMLTQQLESLDEDTLAVQRQPAVHDIADLSLGDIGDHVSSEAVRPGMEPAADEWVVDEPDADPWALGEPLDELALNQREDAGDDSAHAELMIDAGASAVAEASQTRPRRDEFHLPGEGEDDPFLAELRRAIEDPDQAGPAADPEVDPLERPDGELDDPLSSVASVSSATDLRGMPEGGRLSGRLFRRR